MLKNISVSIKVFIITSILCLTNIGIYIYQVINFKISSWNTIPTILIVLIIAGNLKNMLSSKVKRGEVAPSQFGAPPSSENKQKRNVKNEDFYALNTSFPSKLSKTNIIVKIVFVIIFGILSVVFYNCGNKTYDYLVQGQIVTTSVEGGVYEDVGHDGNIYTDTRKLEMLVTYEFNGETFEIVIVDAFSNSRDSDKISLCVKNNGDYICVYDNLISYNIMFYTSIILIILTILGFVFKSPNQYLIMNILMFLGMGTICLFNSYDWSFWLLKDFTLFGGCFFILGLICNIQFFLLRIIFKWCRRRDPDYILN